MEVLEPSQFSKHYDPCKVVFGVKGYFGQELNYMLMHPLVNIRAESITTNGVVAIIHPFLEESEVTEFIFRVNNLVD